MSKAEKLLAKMRHNPKGDYRIEELETIARMAGLSANRPLSGSSHVTFRAPNATKVTVPDHRPIKATYIKQFVELIDKAIGGHA